MSRAVPTEFVVGNMVLRVLKLVREEHSRLLLGGGDETLLMLADPYDSLHVSQFVLKRIISLLNIVVLCSEVVESS